MDRPCSQDGVGPYGPPDGPGSDSSGGFALFPSTTPAPSSGSEFVLCDNDNPHHSFTGADSDHERIQHEVIADGLMTHIGVKDRSGVDEGAVNWTNDDGDSGGSASVLVPPWVRGR